MKRCLTLMITMLLIVAGPSFADDKKALSGSGEVGFLMTSGNSETESVNAGAGLKYENKHLLGEVNLGALYRSEETEVDGQTEDRTAAEKYNARTKIGYKFSPADYVFLYADYEDDRFSGYDYRSSYSIGYGRKVINRDTVKLDIEIGPGYRYDKTDNSDTENEALFRGYAKFKYTFSKGVSFQQDITVLADAHNTATKSITAFKSQIAGALSMKATYKVDHDTHVPEDKDSIDRETSLTLVYDF